jgi:hypothetical protein
MSKTHTRRKPARATEDSFVAPKAKRQPKPITLQEALAESGEDLAELTAPAADETPLKAPREPGSSNLACTIRQHRHRYVPALHPVSGKKTANNGDRVARILLGVSLLDLRTFVHGQFGREYSRLNPGHERMCCGNLIRAAAMKADANTLAQLAIWAPAEPTEG